VLFGRRISEPVTTISLLSSAALSPDAGAFCAWAVPITENMIAGKMDALTAKRRKFMDIIFLP
jgi:hypothetical protein